jgi:hypothetical protein
MPDQSSLVSHQSLSKAFQPNSRSMLPTVLYVGILGVNLSIGMKGKSMPPPPRSYFGSSPLCSLKIQPLRSFIPLGRCASATSFSAFWFKFTDYGDGFETRMTTDRGLA